MKLVFHKDFIKAYKKLSKNLQNRTDERIVLFEKDPFDTILNNHALHGKHQGLRSINIAGDLRAIYRKVDLNSAVFVVIGSHHQLYK